MLEHGECSTKPHVGTHGDIVQGATSGALSQAAVVSRGARTQAHTKSESSAPAPAPATAARKEPHKSRAHPQAVVSVPTAGTVMTGWAKDVGSWF